MKLLVVDDDEASCRLVAAIFKSEGFEVLAASDGQAGLERIAADQPDVVLLDLRLPGLGGLEVLERARQAHPEIPILMMTAHGEVRSAVRATQLGAADYLTKPIDLDEIVAVVRRAAETRALRVEVAELRRQLGEGGSITRLMGPSREAALVAQQVQRVAATGFSVLILGETGTGKELVAQALHQQSDRHSQPFFALDCGAIPDALLESELFGYERGAFTGAERRKEGQLRLAEGGTVFLDEIGNLPLLLQAKLLRVLESRQVQAVGGTRATRLDVRFVAATNDDLAARVAAGLFRADLYFRLAQYTITLPPLRDRPGDVAHLAQRFLGEVSVELRRPVHRIAPDTLAVLQRYRWPGNVRELRNVVRRAVLETSGVVLRSEDVEPLLTTMDAHAPVDDDNSEGTSLKDVAAAAAREAERQAICRTLRRTGGNKAQAARLLQTDYKTLHLKMKSFGIRAADFTS